MKATAKNGDLSMRTIMRRLVSTFSFYGRARRRDYAIYVLVSIMAFLAWSPIVFAAMIKSAPQTIIDAYDKQHVQVPSLVLRVIALPNSYVLWANIVAASIILLLYLAWIALCVRRLHDMRLSGWLFMVVFVISLIPYLGYLFCSAALALVPGSVGRNRYGRDPRGRDPAVAEVFEGARAPP